MRPITRNKNTGFEVLVGINIEGLCVARFFFFDVLSRGDSMSVGGNNNIYYNIRSGDDDDLQLPRATDEII